MASRAEAVGVGRLAPVATNVHLPVRVSPPDNVSDAGSLITRMRHVLQRGASGIRLVYANWSNVDGRDVPGPDPITVSAKVVTDAEHDVVFSGSRHLRLEPGEAGISDPVDISGRAGLAFLTDTTVEPDPGGTVPLGSQTNADDGEGVAPGASAVVRPGTAHGYGPWQVLGDIGSAAGTAPTVLVTGDSNAVGFGDVRGSAYHLGWVQRALQPEFPTLNLAVSGATARGALSGPSRRRRRVLLQWARPRVAIAALGTNDLQQGGPGLVEMQDLLIEHWRDLAALGSRVLACTIPPVTTSGDGWRTLAGQTPTAGARVRAQVNDWLRSVPSPLAGVIDVAAALGAPASPSLWRPGFTRDGLHPNQTGHRVAAERVDPAFLRA